MSGAYRSRQRIQTLLNAVTQKTGIRFSDLTAAVQELCTGYNAPIGGSSSVIPDVRLKTSGRLSALLSFINTVTGISHRDLTSAIQTLCDGYEASPLLYSFAALSDPHIQYAENNGVEDLRRALPYLDDKVAFICICGDLVAWASDDYMAQYKNVIEDTSLTTKPIYECAGNHETYPSNGVSGTIDKTLWETTTGWANHATNGCVGDSLYYYFAHGNDIFIMLSLVSASPYATFAEGALDWLENLLEANKNKRCFVFQHVHDENDGSADPSHGYSNMLNGTDGQRFINLMKHYKNAVWFHGHTHLSIDVGLDADGFGKPIPEYTPIATGLGYRAVHVPSLQGERYYNPTSNALQSSYKYYTDSGSVATKQGGQHAEGYIVDVYGNKIVLRGIDFSVHYYNADWTSRYEVEPMEDKVFTLKTD